MKIPSRQEALNDLLGSAHLFVAAISGVMEQQLLSEIGGSRLTLAQLKILKLVDLTQSSNVGDVAAFMGVSAAAASMAVDRLVRGKYLRRTEARLDRRSSHISLAEAGRSALNRYEAAKDRKLAEIFGHLDINELQETSVFLERLTTGVIHGSAKPEEVCLQCGIYLRKRCLVREAVRAECQYQRRKTKREARSDATRSQTPTRSRPGMGPPD